MNRIDHKEAAEALLELLPQADPDADSRTLLVASVLLQRAQVHATLAAAEVTPMPAPAVKSWPLCECSFLPEPHVWGSPCPRCGCARVKGPHRPGQGPCGAYSSDRLWAPGDLNRNVLSDGPGQ